MNKSPLINSTELNEIIESPETVIIDTRSPDQYKLGHIPRAVNIHEIFTFLSTSTKDGMKDLSVKFAKTFGDAGLSGDELAVIYEESMDTGFGQSCRGYFLLKYLGYPNATVLHGGFKSWIGEGFEITTDEVKNQPKSFGIIESASNLILTKEDMLESLNDNDIVKLDVRDVDEWVGTSSSPYGIDFCPRKGRLPGAVWLEWYRMMKPGKNGPVFKTKNEIQAECSTVGIGPDTTVFLYCFKGARASNTFVALKEAGVKDVRMYFGSWNEWSRIKDLPIDDNLLNWSVA